jgi:iron(III) transport system substrate-binding protein
VGAGSLAGLLAASGDNTATTASAPATTAAPAATTAAAGAATTAAAGGAAPIDNTIIEASKKENSAVVYSIMSAQSWAPVIASFNKKYPWIKVDTVDLGSNEVFERYYSESASKANTADMIITNGIDGWLDFIGKGEALPFKASEDAQLPDWSKPAPNIYTVSTDPMIFIWNKQLMPTPPKTMAELAAMVEKDPAKFKGKVTTYDAETNATGFSDNWFWIKKKGEDGWKILESLGKAPPVLQSSAGNMVNGVLSGQYLLGYFVSLPTVLGQLPAAEAILGWSMINDGTPVVLRSMGITKAAAHPNSAKLLTDFILSQEGEIAFAEGFLTSYRPDVADKAKYSLTKYTAQAGGEQNLINISFDPDLKDKTKKDAFVARWKKSVGKA